MKPSKKHVTLHLTASSIKNFLLELVLRPRRDLAKWADLTKQTPNIKLGYPAQHLASLITGVEGTRTGARGHDLADGSEVKSCSRLDQLDKCRDCRAAVARIEATCPGCDSANIKRNNDSKWLIGIRNKDELRQLLDEVPRIIFIISDYLDFSSGDWTSLRFQAFEIWPKEERHKKFRTLMENYFEKIYLAHIKNDPTKTPAPKNFWPYSFQFYMCNPVRTFHCIVTRALHNPQVKILDYVKPTTDRSAISSVPMPFEILDSAEKKKLHASIDSNSYKIAEQEGVNEMQRDLLKLRDTDLASPQRKNYQRGSR